MSVEAALTRDHALLAGGHTDGGMPARQAKVETLLELCVARAAGGKAATSFMAGVKALPQAMRVQLLIAQWAMVQRELGGKFPTTAEYAEWWQVEERTGWRHRAAIRELFTDDEMRQLVATVAAAMADRSRSAQDAARVEVALS